MKDRRDGGRYGDRPTGRTPAPPWVIRVIAVVAVLVVLGALAYSAANGVLFSTGR